MSLQVKVYCSNHQRNTEPKEEKVWIDTIDANTATLVKHHLERKGWVVQFNGEHMDTYCSKKCAE